MRRFLKALIPWLVAFLGTDAIFTALDIEHNIIVKFDNPSNAGKFAVYLGVVVGLFMLTNWLLERLPYFRNKGGA